MCINPNRPVNTSSEWRELLRIILNPVTAVFGEAYSIRYYKGERGPVCSGKVPCGVREVRR